MINKIVQYNKIKNNIKNNKLIQMMIIGKNHIINNKMIITKKEMVNQNMNLNYKIKLIIL